MKPDISEFSYGYALTNEIIRTSKSTLGGAPVFPSLIDEGGLGYDLKLPIIGAPLFLQFKLSDHMVRSSAVCADKVPTPHYRMHLRSLKHSQQHNLLLALENRGHRVFYAAPEFHKSADLNRAYLEQEIIRRTAFFRPTSIGGLDDSEHIVCFRPGSDHGFLCSEPARIWRDPHEKVLMTLSEESHIFSDDRRPAIKFFEETAADMADAWAETTRAYRSTRDMLDRIRTTREPWEYLGWVAQVLFDCAVLVMLRRTD